MGELADKISILEIKSQRLVVKSQLDNVRRELQALRDAWQQQVTPTPELQRLLATLKTVNETLWDVEDDIRAHEARGDFGESFVQLARRVYLTNDERSQVKRAINERCGSRLIEEKSYSNYDRCDSR